MKVAIHNGWLTVDDRDGHCHCRRLRIRLSDVTRYGYADDVDMTIVWQTGTSGMELNGDHVEALDGHFAAKETA